MGLQKRLSILLCTTLIFSLVFSAVTPALAKSAREAVVDSVVGEVEVTKAGGSKSYQAFVGMTLNQGDHIETGTSSKVVLRIVDHEDEITIDEKSSMYISELSENTKGKKSKMKMWAGSLWGKVKTLTGTDDEFEVETPTAVMGVRGTNLLIGVDPETGESKFYIASGEGNVSKKGEEDQGNGTTLNANEQIKLDDDTQSDDYDDYKNVADLDDLITNTSNAIIEAIVASKAAIDKENEDYIEKLRNDTNSTQDQEAIDRINQNLNNLVGNIVKNAIGQNKVDETEIKAFIDKINEQLDKKLDLDNVKAQELSAQEKAKQEQIKLLEEERKKKQDAEKLKQEELKKQNEELQKKLKDQLEKQKAEKEKAEEAAKKKAQEDYAKKLSDDAARLAFEAKQKALADEKAKQDAAKAIADAAAKAAADAAAKAAAAAAAKAAADAAEAARKALEAANQTPSTTIINPKVITEVVQGTLGNPAELSISLQDFGTRGIYGAQFHFTYNDNVSYSSSSASDLQQFTSGIFAGSNVEYRIEELNYTCGGGGCHELIVVVTKYDGENQTVNAKSLLVTLPFYNDLNSTPSTITLSKVIIVDKAGTKHTTDLNQATTPINYNQQST
ncbi:MAG: FecR domain-containing protein [Paenibacillaceae bacterium]